jgi:hypothetical protein
MSEIHFIVTIENINQIPDNVTHLVFSHSITQHLNIGTILNSNVQFNFENLDTKDVQTIEDCSICLESTSSIITSCNHQYCTYCIQNWINIRRSCPFCRKNLYNTNLFLIKNE